MLEEKKQIIQNLLVENNNKSGKKLKYDEI